MVDVEHAYRIDGRDNRPCAPQFDIADNKKVGGIAFALCRALDQIEPRQYAERAWELVVDENARLLAEAAEEMHQSERRSDGVAVRTDV